MDYTTARFDYHAIFDNFEKTSYIYTLKFIAKPIKSLKLKK